MQMALHDEKFIVHRTIEFTTCDEHGWACAKHENFNTYSRLIFIVLNAF